MHVVSLAREREREGKGGEVGGEVYIVVHVSASTHSITAETSGSAQTMDEPATSQHLQHFQIPLSLSASMSDNTSMQALLLPSKSHKIIIYTCTLLSLLNLHAVLLPFLQYCMQAINNYFWEYNINFFVGHKNARIIIMLY